MLGKGLRRHLRPASLIKRPTAALGQSLHLPPFGMSGLHPKATDLRTSRDVRNVPRSRLMHRNKHRYSITLPEPRRLERGTSNKICALFSYISSSLIKSLATVPNAKV